MWHNSIEFLYELTLLGLTGCIINSFD